MRCEELTVTRIAQRGTRRTRNSCTLRLPSRQRDTVRAERERDIRRERLHTRTVQFVVRRHEMREDAAKLALLLKVL